MRDIRDKRVSKMLINDENSMAAPRYPNVQLSELVFFCCYILIWYLQMGIRVPLLGAIRIEMIWALILIGIIFTSNYATFPNNPLTAIALFFVGIMIVSIPFSCNVSNSWEIFFNRVVKFSFMGLFIACFVKSPRDLRFFIAAFLIACGKLGQEGMFGQLTGSMVWENQGTMRLHGSTPLYFHPNSFSGMALGTIPFILYLWKIVNKRIKLLLLLLFVCSFSIVLFTGSRTGYLAFILMSAVAFFQSEKKIKAFIIVAVLAVVAVIFMPPQYKERFFSSFTSYKNEETSAGKRVQILEDAVAIFFDHPFGIGIGAFPAMRLKTFGRKQDTHNLYLEVLTNLGVQGFVFFSFFIAKMLALLRRLNRNIKEQLYSLKRIHGNQSNLSLIQHCRDLELMRSIVRAVFLFVCVRLGVGLFGMDLYEIYWWFAFGLSVALFQMNNVAEMKTFFFQHNNLFQDSDMKMSSKELCKMRKFSNYSILKSKFKNSTSEAAGRPQIYPDFISGWLSSASNRGRFARIAMSGRTYPSKLGGFQGFQLPFLN